MSLKVSDLMTSPVETVAPEAGFKQIAVKLRERAISAVPVIDPGGKVIGVVSEADLLFKEERASLDSGHHLLEARGTRTARVKAAGSTARQVMTSPAVTIGPDATAAEAARLMHRRAVKRLPVVDEAGRIVGILSRGDLLKVFARTDDEIRKEIVHDVIEHTLMLEVEPIAVAVEDGIVRVSGVADRKTDVELIGRLALRVAGVVDVHNELRYNYDDTKMPPQPPRQRDTLTFGL
jgi:CBS domain-containing protein